MLAPKLLVNTVICKTAENHSTIDEGNGIQSVPPDPVLYVLTFLYAGNGFAVNYKIPIWQLAAEIFSGRSCPTPIREDCIVVSHLF